MLKSTRNNIKKDPLSVTSDCLVDDVTKRPSLAFGKIFSYVLKIKEFDAEYVGKYKDQKGYCYWLFRNSAENWGEFQILSNRQTDTHHHMKDHVEIGYLTKYDAFRVDRDQAMNLEICFKIHTNVSQNVSMISVVLF